MEKKKSINVLLLITRILIVAEFFARLTYIQNDTFSGVLVLISLAFIAVYCFGGYKKPHGNLLKYAMLVFALSEMLRSAYALAGGVEQPLTKAFLFGVILACGIVCYGAGRLNKIEKNRILFPIVDAFFLAENVYAVAAGHPTELAVVFVCFECFIAFSTIMIAYFVRYRDHKEAGLLDKPKAE